MRHCQPCRTAAACDAPAVATTTRQDNLYPPSQCFNVFVTQVDKIHQCLTSNFCIPSRDINHFTPRPSPNIPRHEHHSHALPRCFFGCWGALVPSSGCVCSSSKWPGVGLSTLESVLFRFPVPVVSIVLPLGEIASRASETAIRCDDTLEIDEQACPKLPMAKRQTVDALLPVKVQRERH